MENSQKQTPKDGAIVRWQTAEDVKNNYWKVGTYIASEEMFAIGFGESVDFDYLQDVVNFEVKETEKIHHDKSDDGWDKMAEGVVGFGSV